MRSFARFVLLLPRNAGVLVLRGYRAAISPLYGDVCRYYPSCSAYGLGSVQQRGLVVGSVLTAWRIVRCNPWTPGGIDEVRSARHDRDRITTFGWVVPRGMFPKAEARAAAAREAHRLEHVAIDRAAGGSPAPEASDLIADARFIAEPALATSAPIPSRKD
ncbi:membrane protein insertion efficiency factor YidD [Agromyces soli]